MNDDGSWTGTSVGTTDLSADGAGIGYFALTGSGGYEGLSAILFQPEIFDEAARKGEFPFAVVGEPEGIAVRDRRRQHEPQTSTSANRIGIRRL